MKRSIREVCGNHILLEIKPEDHDKSVSSDVEGKTEGGLFIPKTVKDNLDSQALHSTEIGKVVMLGEDCFIKLHATKPFCDIGDEVMIIPHMGYLFHDEIENKRYRVIRDVDVIAVLKRG